MPSRIDLFAAKPRHHSAGLIADIIQHQDQQTESEHLNITACHI
jgi:hypothetical protein